MDGWAKPDDGLGPLVQDLTDRRLKAYAVSPGDVIEHANIELNNAQGGYGRRQVFELIQNGADALLDAGAIGRIELLLTETAFYCANEGAPLDPDGTEALLSSHRSPKRGLHIGRFGLGFKSVLGITDHPLILSRTGSFGFDAVHAMEAIRRATGSDFDRYPVLRVPMTLDPDEQRERDPLLAELMSWATTVVKLPLRGGDLEWLRKDLAGFPAEFLLFSPHVSALQLRDLTAGEIDRRVSAVGRTDGVIELDADGHGEIELWKAFRSDHSPSPEAREDAGEWADRDEVPVTWAVPLRRRKERGNFWAFFPTALEMTLAGIVNAPWHMNNDRRNILEGRFNEELVDAAASVVADHIGELFDVDDPCRHLELLPATRRDTQAEQWDRVLAERIYESLASSPVLPDQTGVLRRPFELSLMPSGVPEGALEAWRDSGVAPVDWVHHSVATGRQRHPRAAQLVEPSDLPTWLEALAGNRDPAGSIAAIQAFDAISRMPNLTSAQRFRLDRASVVLTDQFELRRIDDGDLVITDGDPEIAEDDEPVHAEVAAHQAARDVLRAHGVAELHGDDPIRPLLRRVDAGEDVDWGTFWNAVDRMGVHEALRALDESALPASSIHVRTVAGTWRGSDEVLLPGPVVSAESSPGHVVDVEAHGSHALLLSRLGIVALPEPGMTDFRTWNQASEYLRAARRAYYDADWKLPSKPQWGYLVFRSKPPFAGPLAVLKSLDDDARGRYSAALLHAEGDLAPWQMGHKTRDVYPTLEYEHPLIWLLRREGRLNTPHGPLRIDECVHPALAAVSPLLPCADVEHGLAEQLGLPQRLESMTRAQWEVAFRAARSHDDASTAAQLYVEACTHTRVPGQLLALGPAGPVVAPADGVLAVHKRFAKVLAARGKQVVPVSHEADAALLADSWGLRKADAEVERFVRTEGESEPVPLLELYPGVSEHDPLRDLELVTCRRLVSVTDVDGESSFEDVSMDLAGQTLFVDLLTTDEEIVAFLESHFDLRLEAERLVEGWVDEDVEDVRATVRAARTDAERVVYAVGPRALHDALPASLAADVEMGDAQRLGQIALAVWGVDVLRQFRDRLQANGLNPPTSWTGQPRARRFVTDLGFPPEYAGFPDTRLDKSLEVLGRPQLPDLHPFQRQVRDRLRDLLGRGPARGLISLPTGAGKTRTAVQGLIEHGVAKGAPYRILWLAQTEELCEQAVQTFAEAWRALGPDTALTISRLWTSHDAAPIEGYHVVIATVAKMASIAQRHQDRYRWLTDVDALVVDEAHGSTTPSYSDVLRFLGYRVGRTGEDPAPMVGLTATPFRGVNEEETKRLIGRYDANRLDHGLSEDDDLHAHLQSIGVLAYVDHELLEGSSFDLDDRQLEHFERFSDLPAEVEAAISNDRGRNDRIIDLVTSMDDDWPVLVFAASVEHAEVLAALLELQGVTARPISGQTRRAARRHYISQFRSGQIRVLTNYNVLAEGFDAPRVRSVIVARPTFSPNRYQQIIGRGLRGPANGGDERCLIVNVADNFQRFGRELAFKQFEYLWAADPAG